MRYEKSKLKKNDDTLSNLIDSKAQELQKIHHDSCIALRYCNNEFLKVCANIVSFIKWCFL